MKEMAMLGCILAVACGGADGGADTAAARDSAIVAGPPAAPVTLPAPADSAAKAAPVATTTRPPSTKTQTRPTDTPAVSPARPVADDSVRGIVSVVGTSFEKRVMVAVPGTSRRVEITGPLARLVGHVAGAEVSVVGKPAGSRIEATSFLVRSVDNQPAIDGTLRTEGGAVYIVTAKGVRTRIAAPPPQFEGQDGARVWITGDPAKGVSSFGFIDPPR